MGTVVSQQLPRHSQHSVIGWIARMLAHPLRTSQQLARETGIRPAATLVIGWGAITTILFGISHLNKDYPPPQEVMQLWIEAWGTGTMLPLVNLPLEQYRLFMAVTSIPLALVLWMLIAGSARLLSLAFNGKASYEQYLSLLAFAFFPFWVIAALLDSVFSGLLGDYVNNALRLDYGPLVRSLVVLFPQLMYTVVFGIGALYSGLVVQAVERWFVWKSFLTGAFVLFWTVFLIAVLWR